MKKSRKDLIFKLYNEVSSEVGKELKKEFPKLFKEKPLEVGKWYKHDRFLQLYNGNFGNDVTYGFREDGSFCDKMGFHDYDKRTLATDKEVEIALIKESKNRGFKEGVSFNCVVNLRKGFYGDLIYCQLINGLYSDKTEDGEWLFYNGKWATVIETITKEQAEKELGKTILN